MINENEKFIPLDATEVLQNAIDKDDFQEKVDYDQPQNLKQTPDPVFII